MQTVPSGRLQNTPPPYFPAMVAYRRLPMGWRCSAPSKGLDWVVLLPQIGDGGVPQLPLDEPGV